MCDNYAKNTEISKGANAFSRHCINNVPPHSPAKQHPERGALAFRAADGAAAAAQQNPGGAEEAGDAISAPVPAAEEAFATHQGVTHAHTNPEPHTSACAGNRFLPFGIG